VVVELSEQLLEIGAHVVTAILATWLGLLVMTRATSARGTRVFVFLCALLVLWSVSIIVQRTTGDAALTASINLFEDVAAWLLPAATVHIALVIAFEGRYTRTAMAVLVVAYGLGVLGIVQAIADPTHPIAFDEPNWEPFGIDGLTVAWAFTALRALVFAAAIGYLVAGLRAAGDDRARRRQLLVALATVAVGVTGGMLRILPPELGGPRFVGVALVAVAVVLATYAVVAQHVFLASDVAARAVRWSLAGGIAVVAYVVAVLALDAAVSAALDIDIPIVTALAIVGTLALFEPVSDWVRGRIGPDSGSADEQRLLVALGADPLLTQAPDRALEPALERIARTFELSGAAISSADGQVLASVGDADPERPDGLRLGLEDGGRAIFVPRPGRSFTRSELGALQLASGYLASSLRLAERQDRQIAAIGELRVEREAVASRRAALQDALAHATDPDDALHVFALGPLRAERGGEVLRRWGGQKAGSRQAEAIFALLFDRGERGASKDEILEIVWPDVDLERADVAFHRTLLGLRATLRPGRRGGSGTAATGEPITFHNDRYRLDPSIVAWSDLAEFERLLALAQGGGDGAVDPVDALEQARALYRGEYLDDVPYLGDSAVVEERREQLRDSLGDVLTELAARYAERGDRVASAACERQAAAVAEGAYAPPLTTG
jgi:DNA-binding SARP family transcriptional activator